MNTENKNKQFELDRLKMDLEAKKRALEEYLDNEKKSSLTHKVASNDK